MYKGLFQNSKMALLFAGMTVLSAVSMIGTSEDGGLVTKTVDMVEARRTAFAGEAQEFAQARSEGDEPPPQPVFGEFDGVSGASASGKSGKPAQGGGGPMTAPMSSTAIVAERGSSTVVGVPYISDRELTIEPE